MRMNDSLWMLFPETRVISSEGDCSCQLIFFCPGIPAELFFTWMWAHWEAIILYFGQQNLLPTPLPIPGVVYFPA